MSNESAGGSQEPLSEEEFAAAWARVREIEARIDKARGTVVRQRMEALGRSIAMLDANGAELMQALDAFSNPALEMTLWNEENEGLLDMFLTEIARRLHNYVASVMTLVEHNRRLVREQYAESDPLRKAYQERLEETFGTPEVAFVQDLRDFTVHYALPPISARLSFGRDQPTRSEILLDRDALRTFSGWSKKGKAFLGAGTEPIDLRAVVAAYMKTVREFYEWFTSAAGEHHKADEADLNALVDEMRAAFRAAGHGAYVDHADQLNERRKAVVAEAMARAQEARQSPGPRSEEDAPA